MKWWSIVEVLACFQDEGGDSSAPLTIQVKGIKHPVSLRRKSSDFHVFRQVFLEDQYSFSIDKSVQYIIDAGANVGLASISFLERYPDSVVVAIEPDESNFEVAKRNLSRYGDRCRLIRAAIWSQDGELEVSKGTFLDGREWSTQTVPVTSESKNIVLAISLESLVRQVKFPRIDILKMDIEGAELEVFKNGKTDFLKITKMCAIECHGEDCYNAYAIATQREGFTLTSRGELTIAQQHQ